MAICQQQEVVKELQPPNRFYLNFNPIPMLHGPIPNTSEYRIGMEVVGGEQFSYQIAGSYLNKSILVNALAGDSLRNLAADYEFPGFRFQIQAKYYWLKLKTETVRDRMIPAGLYTALHTSYAAATWKPKDLNYPRQDWSNFTINGLIGAQFMIDDDFGIDIFTGLGYKENRSYLTDTRNRVTEINIREELGGALGNYIGGPSKITMGFHLTFGVL